MNNKRNLNRPSSRYQCGAILVEFVFVIPIILVLILGGFEMARYIRVHQIANKISYEMANVLLRTCVNSVSQPAHVDPIYIELQNERTGQCYDTVFDDYVKKQNIVLAFGNNMLNNPYSINSVMVNRNSANVSFCRGTETRAGAGMQRSDTGLKRSSPGNPLTADKCFKNPSISGVLSPNPSRNRPDPGNFQSVISRVSGTAIVSESEIAIWTEVSIAYSPVIQRLLLPFIGFHAGGDDGSVNNVTATSVTY